jgi:hypothetical protein
MTKIYSRAAVRVVFLFVLAFALASFARPTSVQAFDCASDCRAAFDSCVAVCRSLPHPPTEGCLSFCSPDYEDCLASC